MHPYKILITCCGHPEQIDLNMTRLCKALWAAGIHLKACAQAIIDDPGPTPS